MVLAHRKTNWFHRQSKRQRVFLRRSWAESRNSLLAEPNFKEPIETRNHHKHQDFKIFFIFEALQRGTAVIDQRVQGPLLLFADILVLANHFQVQGGRSKVNNFCAKLPNQFSGSQNTLPKPETSALGLEGTTFHAHKLAWKRESAPGTHSCSLLLEHGWVSFHSWFGSCCQFFHHCQNLLSRWVSRLQLAGHMHQTQQANLVFKLSWHWCWDLTQNCLRSIIDFDHQDPLPCAPARFLARAGASPDVTPVLNRLQQIPPGCTSREQATYLTRVKQLAIQILLLSLQCLTTAIPSLMPLTHGHPEVWPSLHVVSVLFPGQVSLPHGPKGFSQLRHLPYSSLFCCRAFWTGCLELPARHRHHLPSWRRQAHCCAPSIHSTWSMLGVFTSFCPNLRRHFTFSTSARSNSVPEAFAASSASILAMSTSMSASRREASSQTPGFSALKYAKWLACSCSYFLHSWHWIVVAQPLRPPAKVTLMV